MSASDAGAFTRAVLTLCQMDWPPFGETYRASTGIMSTMYADQLDVETFAQPEQQRRFAAAMDRIAFNRRPGTPVRIYVSAPPVLRNSPRWDAWLKQIAKQLPDGVEILHFRNAFKEARRPYNWDGFAEELDGLVVVGTRRTTGSHVYLLGPVARRELRSFIACKPVLLHGHNLGLIPVIDCRNQVLPPKEAPRLKLIAPTGWKADSLTFQASLAALRPAASTPHLRNPFMTGTECIAS